MGLFKKEKPPTYTELKCPSEGCPMTCNDPALLKRHIEWRHPETAQTAVKAK